MGLDWKENTFFYNQEMCILENRKERFALNFVKRIKSAEKIQQKTIKESSITRTLQTWNELDVKLVSTLNKWGTRAEVKEHIYSEKEYLKP